MATGCFKLNTAVRLEISVALVCRYLAHASRTIATFASDYINFLTSRNITGFIEKIQSMTPFKKDEMLIKDNMEVRLMFLVFM